MDFYSIKEHIDASHAVVTRWRGMDEPRIDYLGKSHKAISDPVVDSISQVADIASSPNESIEPPARALVLAIDAFADELHRWYDAMDFGDDSAPPDGTSEMWQAWDAIVAASVPRRMRPPESMDDLKRSGTGMSQIAKIYGWKNPDGSPDTQKVVEEQREPGTHYDPATWVHPADRNLQEEADRRWQRRQPRESRGEPSSQRSGVRHVAPEPLDELIATVDNPEQIARMKGITVEDVEARAAELGVAIAGKFRRPANPDDEREANKAITERQQADYAKSYPEAKDLEERVLLCHLDGWKPGKIAEILNVDHPTLNFQKVGKIIAAANAEDAEKQTA